MSDTDNDEQAQGATPEPTPAPEKTYLNLDEATPEQLSEAMKSPEKFTTEKPEETVEEDAETVEEDADEVAEEDKDHGEEVRPTSRNRVKVRTQHLDDPQRDVLALVSSRKISIPEAQDEVVSKLVRDGMTVKAAEQAVYGGPSRRAASREEREEPKPKDDDAQDEAEATNPVEAKQKEIDQIRADLKVAREAYEVDKIEELRDTLTDAREDLRDLKQGAQSAAAREEESFSSQVELSTARALELFPDAAEEGTELFDAIQDEVEDLKETDPGFFKTPNWPLRLAAVKAAELGIPSSKQKGGATPQSGEQKSAIPPKKQARTLVPASGTSGGGSNRTSASLDPQAEFEAAGNDPEKLLAFVHKHGRRPEGALGLADAFA